jgi:hypothetical protein
MSKRSDIGVTHIEDVIAIGTREDEARRAISGELDSSDGINSLGQTDGGDVLPCTITVHIGEYVATERADQNAHTRGGACDVRAQDRVVAVRHGQQLGCTKPRSSHIPSKPMSAGSNNTVPSL